VPYGMRIRRTPPYGACDTIRKSAIRTPAVAATDTGCAPEPAAGVVRAKRQPGSSVRATPVRGNGAQK